MSTKVWTDKKGTTLRLRWLFEGKRYQLPLGVKDNVTGNAYAKIVAGTIERDIECGNFDQTKERYQNPNKRGRKPKVEISKITAVDLFKAYAADRLIDRELSPSSGGRLKGIASKLGQFLGDKPAAQVTEAVAKDMLTRWSDSASNRTIKAYLFDLRAAWDWAKCKYHLDEPNPWSDRIARIKVQTPKHDDPLSIAEFQAIITAFKAHSVYSFYAEFVIFLSHSACRFGEAAALRWKHLGAGYSTAWIGESISRGHLNKKGTKTEKFRTIEILPSVRAMLVERYERVKPQPDHLVFPAPKGGSMNDHRFRARQWKKILASCNIEYTRPYNIRHSVISHAARQIGVDLAALAEQTGHSKRVLMSTYWHAIDRQCLFVDFGGK
jgi:integrase